MLQWFDRWSRCYGSSRACRFAIQIGIKIFMNRVVLKRLLRYLCAAILWIVVIRTLGSVSLKQRESWEKDVLWHSEEWSWSALLIASKLVSLRDARVGGTVRGCLSLVLEGAEDDDTTTAAVTGFFCDLAAVVRVLMDIEAKWWTMAR